MKNRNIRICAQRRLFSCKKKINIVAKLWRGVAVAV